MGRSFHKNLITIHVMVLWVQFWQTCLVTSILLCMICISLFWTVRERGKLLRYSWYHTLDVGAEQVEADRLRTDAEAYVSALELATERFPVVPLDERVEKTPRRFCVGITTAPRAPHSYLLQTFTSVFRELDPGDVEGGQVYTVLVANGRGHGSLDDAVRVAPYFHRAVFVNGSDGNATQRPAGSGDGASRSGVNANLYAEYADYLRVLEECLLHGSPYLLLLQDDVRATRHVVRKLNAMLSELSAELAAAAAADPDPTSPPSSLPTYTEEPPLGGRLEPEDPGWSAVKLFYSEFYSGWELPSGVAVVVVSLVTGLVVSVVFVWAVLVRRADRGRRKHTAARGLPGSNDNRRRLQLQALILGGCVGMTVAVAVAWTTFALGRQHVYAQFHPGFNAYRPSANCAILYAGGRRALEMHRWLTERLAEGITDPEHPTRLLPVDLAVDLYHESQVPQLAQFIYVPNFFQHIGVFSSLLHKSSTSWMERLKTFKMSLTWQL